MFDRIAPTYDQLNAILSLSIDKVWRRKAIEALKIGTGDTVLDVATGTGDLALLAINRGGKVVGIDLSLQMLRRARAKLDHNHPGSTYAFVQGDALAIPFRDETFNSAMVAFGIRNMEDLEAFLDELYRVLNAHGRLSILEFSMPERWPFRWIYLVYLTYVMPYIGFLISGDYEAYRYLRDSVMRFPSPKTLEGIMATRGFQIVQSIQLSGGISHLYLLEKP